MKRNRVTGKLQAASAKSSQAAGKTSEMNAIDPGWASARKRLEQALMASGRDPAEATKIVARMKAAREGTTADELAVYEEIMPVYDGLVRDGREEFESDLGSLCAGKAWVHIRAGDAAGAIAEFDREVAIRERLVKRQNDRDLPPALAEAYAGKAAALGLSGDKQGAVAFYDLAISSFESLIQQEGRRELLDRACPRRWRSLSLLAPRGLGA